MFGRTITEQTRLFLPLPLSLLLLISITSQRSRAAKRGESREGRAHRRTPNGRRPDLAQARARSAPAQREGGLGQLLARCVHRRHLRGDQAPVHRRAHVPRDARTHRKPSRPNSGTHRGPATGSASSREPSQKSGMGSTQSRGLRLTVSSDGSTRVAKVRTSLDRSASCSSRPTNGPETT
jgi:hypothetical protein